MPAPLDQPGIDFSWHKIIPYAVIQKNYRFVCRYLSHDTSKNISRQEYLEYEKRNIPVVLVWESTPGRADQGHAAGRADAGEAAAQARNVTGRTDCPIYFAVDSDQVASGQFKAVANYFGGVASVLGYKRTGAYAEYDVIDFLKRQGTVNWFWQPAAWSHLKVHPAAHIYQRHNGIPVNGLTVDMDVAFKGPIGAVGTPPMPAPVPHQRPHVLAVWAAHLKLALRMIKLVGPTKELTYYVKKLRGLIATEKRKPK